MLSKGLSQRGSGQLHLGVRRGEVLFRGQRITIGSSELYARRQMEKDSKKVFHNLFLQVREAGVLVA